MYVDIFGWAMWPILITVSFFDEINQINATICDYKNSCFLYIWWFMARLLLNR
ncbi:hypothetical protein SAMN03159434_101533 [Enterobacter sp. NFR05]|nr:hypothetical protein SAMN03159434_101533 [Enterobacter sp. NFR05]